jgi:hypothetical protein
LLFCRGKSSLRRPDGGPCLRVERKGAFGVLPRTVIGEGERVVALRVDFGETRLCCLGIDIGICLLDHRLL